MTHAQTALEADVASRNRIVSEIDENFFVTAGAGSGKTTMLVNRMVAMVESGIDISRICAITFTKAAAREFYGRFQTLLIQRSDPNGKRDGQNGSGQLPAPTDETRRLCAKALENIDLCFMGTIDSFCSQVLSEHPSQAGILSDSSIATHAQTETLYKQEYAKIAKGGYGGKLAALAEDFRALHRNDADMFVRGMTLLMDNRNVHFNFDEKKAIGIDGLDAEFSRRFHMLLRALECLAKHPELKYSGNEPSRKAWDALESVCVDLRRWSKNVPGAIYSLRNVKGLRAIPEALHHHAAVLEAVLKPGGKTGRWLELRPSFAGELIDELEGYCHAISMAFLTRCVPHLERAMRDKGLMTFFDYLYYLRNMLRDDAGRDGKLIRYIYGRHSYVLIDEFQDTNPLQAQVFFYLTAERPNAKWTECVPRKGSLFIVGDPKQSIYRFRGADVESFLRVRDLFERNGDAVVSLSRNFRSTRALCTYFNDAFSELLPDETPEQSKFEEIPLPGKTQDSSTFTGVYAYDAPAAGSKAADQDPEQADPAIITRIIKGLVGDENRMIAERPGDEAREISYGDILVITDNKSKLAPIAVRLHEAGIPTATEGANPFSANAALTALHEVYASVAKPRDRRALYAALTGTVLAFSADDVAHFVSCGGTVSLESARDDALEQACAGDEAARDVLAAIRRLDDARARARRLSCAALFTQLADELEIYRFVPVEGMEAFYYALELLADAQKSGAVTSFEDASAFIESLLDGTSGVERCLSLQDSQDCVRLANLHKVKGLEAPVVILAAASRPNNDVSYRIQHGEDASEGYVFALAASGSRFGTGDYTVPRDAERAAREAEQTRLLYVAATRARCALVICKRGKWEKLVGPQVSDYPAAAMERETDEKHTDEPASAALLYAEGKSESALSDRTAQEPTYAMQRPSSLRLNLASEPTQSDAPDAEGASADSATDKQQQSQPQAHANPTYLGHTVHRLMELLVCSKGSMSADGAIAQVLDEYRTPATEPYEQPVSAALASVAKTMQSGGYPQANGLPADILATLDGADEVYCEVPYCYQETGEDGTVVWSGVMDVVYRSENTWRIIDYKTNAVGSDLDERYRPQLAAYERAFRASTGKSAIALVYHIDV